MQNSSQQPQNAMENATMDNKDMIKEIFAQFTTEGGSPRVTEFKRYIDRLISSEIKPLCGRSSKSSDGSDWRSELKARFGGRGAKWVKTSISEITPTLDNIAKEIDVSAYKTFIDQAGYAWIRFSGPRINAGKQSAAFEVRVSGSTYDHPRQLHYVAVEDLDNVIEPLQGTPHSMKLEVVNNTAPKEEAKTEEVVEEEVTHEEVTQDEVPEEISEDIDLDELAASILDAEFDDDEEDDDIFGQI